MSTIVTSKMLHSHMSRAKQNVERSFSGEREATPLIEWVANGGRRAKNIATLLVDLAKLESLTEPHPDGITLEVNRQGYNANGVFRVPVEVGGRVSAEYKSLWRDVSRRLASYKMFPQLLFRVGDQWVYRWVTRSNRPIFTRPNTLMKVTEEDALQSLLSLACQGYLQRVRRCLQCGRWFFARFSTKKFCRTECQQSYFRSSQEWKAHRREYMRKNRALHRSGYVR